MTVEVVCTVGAWAAPMAAVLIIEPVAEGAWTVTVTEPESPAATAPMVHVTVLPASVPLSLEET